jgi:hypothetical protein
VYVRVLLLLNEQCRPEIAQTAEVVKEFVERDILPYTLLLRLVRPAPIAWVISFLDRARHGQRRALAAPHPRSASLRPSSRASILAWLCHWIHKPERSWICWPRWVRLPSAPFPRLKRVLLPPHGRYRLARRWPELRTVRFLDPLAKFPCASTGRGWTPRCRCWPGTTAEVRYLALWMPATTPVASWPTPRAALSSRSTIAWRPSIVSPPVQTTARAPTTGCWPTPRAWAPTPAAWRLAATARAATWPRW